MPPIRPFAVVVIVLSFSLQYAHANPDAKYPKSPQVHEDATVTFRLIAPNAKSVEVAGSFQKEKGKMTMNEAGVWELTVGPLSPEIYNYSFRVDGTYVMDPHNRWFKGWRHCANLFLIPSNPPANWEIQNVPRGVLHRHQIRSEVGDRDLFVYTPPGYESSRQKYPVLFLLHGSGDDASAWTHVGRANYIADNLIAQGKMKPMVIVMPYGHATFEGMDAIEEKEEWWRRNTSVVQSSFFDDYVPFAQANYRIHTDAKRTAIGGLSMGGNQSLLFGLSHPDQFGWILSYSAGTPETVESIEEYYAKIPSATDRKLLWIGCGKDDFLFKRNVQFCDWLTKRGVAFDWKETKGAHSWPVWRGYLQETLPLLFQE